jgi:hypothetical protein
MASDLYGVLLSDLLPGSIRDDPTVSITAAAIDPELQGAASQTREAVLVPRIGELSGAVLDLLAWQFHVDLYDPTWPDEIRRGMISSFVAWHRLKGTKAGIMKLLTVLGYPGTTILESGDVRKWYEKSGVLRLDGTWQVGETPPRALKTLRSLEGIPDLSHWAEFAVLLDLADAARPGWAQEIHWAVEEMKPVRAWPLWVYRLFLEVLARPSHRMFLAMEKKLSQVYPWENLRLDGTWSVGRDAAVPELTGQALDGIWRIGEAAGEIAGPEIRQRVILADRAWEKSLERPARPFAVRLDTAERWPLRLDGWALGPKNGLLARGREELTIRASGQVAPSLRVGHVVASDLDYPASPCRIVERKLRGRRLDGSWRIGDSPTGVSLDGRRFGFAPPGIEAAWERILEASASVSAPRIGVEVAVLGRGWCRRLDGSWPLGAAWRLDGSWRLVGDHYLTAPVIGWRYAQLDGTWSVGGEPPGKLDGTWEIGGGGPSMTMGTSG